MTDPLQRQTIIFVVRVWAEYLAQEPPTWRGEIVQLTTRVSHNFVTLPEITAFIVAQSLADQPPQTTAQRAEPEARQQPSD